MRAADVAGDSDGALFTLKHVLQRDETYGDAHLLMALIHQHKGNHSMSGQYLETALSFNFEVSAEIKSFVALPTIFKMLLDIKEWFLGVGN